MTPYLMRRLLRRGEEGNFRSHGRCGGLIDFASNDYLGLGRSGVLLSAVKGEWEKGLGAGHTGLGSTGSRLLTGNSSYAEELEGQIAAFHGYEASLLFTCGYMANVGLLSTVGGPDDVIIYDVGVHASVADGIRLSSARSFPFKHSDINHLEYRLKACQDFETRFIAVESIYSTDGSIAPLRNIMEVAERYGAFVIVDEAHAIGIRGPGGRGLVAEHGLQEQVFAAVVTYGKALGVQGAAVLGGASLKDVLINFATSHIYTTAQPLLALAAIKCGYDLLPMLDAERARLQELIAYMGVLGIQRSDTPIQAIPISGNEAVKACAKKLQAAGFDVRALTSPTVRRGKEVLRVCLHAFNTPMELKSLVDHL
jgi:8-amino-7-oxononanoate synthase